MSTNLLSGSLMLLTSLISFTNARAGSVEGLSGLVEVPALFGKSDPNGPPGQRPPQKPTVLKLRSEPSEGSKVAYEVSKPEDLVSSLHGLDEKSAVAVKQQDGWFLIKTKTGQGWLASQDAGRFRSYESLVTQRPAFMNGNWDGRLYKAPAQQKKFEKRILKPFDPARTASFENVQLDVKVLGSRTVAGRLWFRIQVVEGRCEAQEKLGQRAWVPAFNETNEPSLWFHAGSC